MKDTPAPARRFEFTRARVDGATCEPGKSQTLYWDTLQPGLGLRVTAKGARSFIFESKLGRETIRLTIGPASMQLRAAKDKRGRPLVEGADTQAAEWAYLISQGRDPRAEVRKATEADQQARAEVKAEKARREVLGIDAWTAYMKARKSKWGERHYADHKDMSAEGTDTTQPGILRQLLEKPLAEIDSQTVTRWAAKEAAQRRTRAQLAFRLLRAFMNWCAEHAEYAAMVQPGVCDKKQTKEELGRPGVKSDSLQREMLRGFFAETDKCTPSVRAYLQGMVLNGARPGEWLALRWEDVDFAHRVIRIRDKVEGDRQIPLTDHTAHLLAGLVRRGPWVFSSVAVKLAKDAVPGRIVIPNEQLSLAVQRAGLPPLTPHGLRRSFKSLSEWCEVPVGIVAQIMGHKPSATAERHYTVRPIDLLRKWHNTIECFILAEAGVEMPERQAQPGLRVVG